MKYIKIIFLINIFFLFNCTSEPKLINRENKNRTDITHSEHIIFIGFDGFGSKFIPKANMPNLKKMINNGSSSMNVYNILPPVSWANWSALFNGTPPDSQTGIDFPSILTIIKNADKNIAYFCEWSGMKDISDKDNIESVYIESTYESTLKIADYIKENKPAFTSIVFMEPDTIGHDKWWGSKQYYKKLELLDSFIPVIIQAVIDAGIYDNTVFIISSDHGGIFFEHQVNLNSIRKIPLVIFGNGIKKGYNITGTVGIIDIAPTMAVILGIDVPMLWTGIPLWEIFK